MHKISIFDDAVVHILGQICYAEVCNWGVSHPEIDDAVSIQKLDWLQFCADLIEKSIEVRRHS